MSLADLSLSEQAHAVGGGEADPAELLADTLQRIGERNPALNAVVATFPEQSRRMLEEAPAGPLHGVPVAIKDEWPLPWRAERQAAAGNLIQSQPGESGPYLRLRDAGAVIVAVTNMHELGSGTTGHVSVYGPARNPWDTGRCTGGSSSGSASAVAGRLVAGAVGADGGGSIRLPSAYCGVTGLKPTHGRVPMDGHQTADSAMIVGGPICRDAADARLLAGALFGEPLQPGDAAGLRIGVPAGDPVWEDCQPRIRTACDAAVEALVGATGGSVAPVAIDGFEHSMIASVLCLTTENLGAVSPAQVAGLGEEVSVFARAGLKYRFLLPAAVLQRAERVRTLLRRSLVEVFEQVDVIAWPTVPAVAPRIDEPVVELPSGAHPADPVNVRSAGLANLCGIPGINLPAGLDDDGLPVGLQLQAAWGRDGLLLDAAEALERATDRRYVEQSPPVAEARAERQAGAVGSGS